MKRRFEKREAGFVKVRVLCEEMFIETAKKFGFGDSIEVEKTDKESDIVRVVNLIIENEKKLRHLETEMETKLYRK